MSIYASIELLPPGCTPVNSTATASYRGLPPGSCKPAPKLASTIKMTGPAELALIASPAGAEVEGRLTPCREVDGGLVGLTVAGSDTRAAGIE